MAARSSVRSTTYQMGPPTTLSVAASMISDVYGQPAAQPRRKQLRKPRVSTIPHPTQISCSTAEGNGPMSAILIAQTKVPKAPQPPRCSTQKSVALERVRPEASVIELSVLICVLSARARHGRKSAISRNIESSARLAVSLPSTRLRVRLVALLVRFTEKVIQSTAAPHDDLRTAAPKANPSVNGRFVMARSADLSVRALRVARSTRTLETPV